LKVHLKFLRGRIAGIAFILLFLSPSLSWAEIELVGKEGKLLKTKEEDFSLTSEISERTDIVMMNNILDLDNKKDDKFTYIGIDYSVSLDAKYQDWLEAALTLERSGPTDYDAPILGRSYIPTIYGPVDRYKNSDLLPELESFFVDIRLPFTTDYPVRVKAGLFPIEIGNGLAVSGYYENYGAALYHPSEKFSWDFYYFRPDLNNDHVLGPNLDQEESLGRGYQHTVANLFAADAIYYWKKADEKRWWIPGGSVQPYLSFLSDQTGAGKRSDLFETQTKQDLLGTLGADLNLEFGRLSVGFEAAKNFGKAQSKGGGKDIGHTGYTFYSDASYDLHEWWIKPRTKVLFASGNNLESSDENETLQGSRNRAFSVYSPLNTNLSDSVYPPQSLGPMLATGKVYGLNFGVPRPGTFGDPSLIENLIAPNIGFDFNPFALETITLSFDWWYMATPQRGIGTVGGHSKELSRDIGNEFDWNVSIDLTDHINLGMTFGYILPGRYYQERREDEGTDFSPLIRGDGDADNAFYGDFRFTFTF